MPKQQPARTTTDGGIQAAARARDFLAPVFSRSEEHTSELQSRLHLVCRLLLEKKNYLHPRAPSRTSARALTSASLRPPTKNRRAVGGDASGSPTVHDCCSAWCTILSCTHVAP